MRSAVVAAAVAAVACAAGAAFFWLKPAPATVRADRGSVAVAGNVGRDVIVNQFDDDEDRKGKAARFVKNAHRVCQNYVKQLSQMSIEKRVSSGDTPLFDFNGLYYSADLVAVLSAATYETLGRTQKELQKLSGDLFQIRTEYMTMWAFATAQDQQEVAQKFAAIRNDLQGLTQSHCQYLLTLDD